LRPYRLGSDDSTLGTSKALARAAIGHNATVFTAIANDESKNTSSTDGKSVYDAASHCHANHSNHGAVAAIFSSPTASTRLAHADACCRVAAAAVGFCASIFSASLQGLIANFRDSQPQQRQLPVPLQSLQSRHQPQHPPSSSHGQASMAGLLQPQLQPQRFRLLAPAPSYQEPQYQPSTMPVGVDESFRFSIPAQQSGWSAGSTLYDNSN
ncbi:hypothetical protein E4U49_000805, partial [Claviceps purpurea]